MPEQYRTEITTNLSGGFFDALIDSNNIPDRVYSANDYAVLFDGVVTDGVFANAGDGLTLSKASTIVTINTGRAWLSHHWAYVSAPIDIDFTAQLQQLTANLQRTYAVCLYYSRNSRAFSIRVKAAEYEHALGQDWYLEEYMPLLDKDEPDFDAVYTLGYVVLAKSGTSSSLTTYASIYSPLRTIIPGSQIEILVSYNKPSERIYYATPYASALFDITPQIENRFQNVETRASQAYAFGSTYMGNSSKYEQAYVWGQTYNSKYGNYETAISRASAFNANKNKYDYAYSWVSSYGSYGSRFNDIANKATLAYEAAFPSQSGIIPVLQSKVDDLWASRNENHLAYTYGKAWWEMNWQFVAIAGNVASRGGEFHVDFSSALPTGSATTVATLNLYMPEDPNNTYNTALWQAHVCLQFKSLDETDTIAFRQFRLRARYWDGRTKWLNDDEPVVQVTNQRTDYATVLNGTVNVPGYFNDQASNFLVAIDVVARQQPAKASQTVVGNVTLLPYGYILGE